MEFFLFAIQERERVVLDARSPYRNIGLVANIGALQIATVPSTYQAVAEYLPLLIPMEFFPFAIQERARVVLVLDARSPYRNIGLVANIGALQIATVPSIYQAVAEYPLLSTVMESSLFAIQAPAPLPGECLLLMEEMLAEIIFYLLAALNP